MTTESWKLQKKLQRGQLPTQSQLFRVASLLEIPQEKALFLLIYLTAGRVSEVLGIKKDSVEIIKREGREFMLIKMPNCKNKGRRFKDIPIPLDKEGQFVRLVLEYLKLRSDRLFDFQTTQRAWQILQKVGMNPHWLRHIRLTHLVTIYDFNDQLLRRFAGWYDSRPAKHYMELKWYDMVKKM